MSRVTKRFKGNIVTKTLRFAKQWERKGFLPTRMACKRYIEIFSKCDLKQKRELDRRWEWVMSLPEAGGSIELQELLWQGMMHCYRWGLSLGVEGCQDTTLVLIPRKQGKTDAAARQGLSTLYFSKSTSPKVYSIATRSDQAGISYDFGRVMLEMSDLSVGTKKDCDWQAGSEETGIHYRVNQGRWMILPSTPRKLDGLQGDLFLIDEAAQIDDKLYNVLWSGMSDTVEDQHLLSISTAGAEPNWFTRGVFEAVDRIQAGMVPDINILVWAVPEFKHTDEDPEFNPETDIGKMSTWVKTNPCLGVTIKKERVAKDYRKAKASPSLMIEFCRTRINMFTSKDVHSLCSYAVQKKVSNPDHDQVVEQKLLELPCSMGIDISKSGDPTSVCVSAQDPDTEIIYFKTQDFMCRNSYEHRMERFRANILEHLVNIGQMTLCGHEYLDYEVITRFVAAWAEKYGARFIFSDTATGGMHFRTLMIGDAGIPVLDFGVLEGVKGSKRVLTNTTKNFYIDCLFDDKLKCPESDCYRWELNNAAIETFPDDRKDIVKLAGKDKETALTIDGVYATLHAIFPFAMKKVTQENLPETEEELDDWFA